MKKIVLLLLLVAQCVDASQKAEEATLLTSEDLAKSRKKICRERAAKMIESCEFNVRSILSSVETFGLQKDYISRAARIESVFSDLTLFTDDLLAEAQETYSGSVFAELAEGVLWSRDISRVLSLSEKDFDALLIKYAFGKVKNLRQMWGLFLRWFDCEKGVVKSAIKSMMKACLKCSKRLSTWEQRVYRIFLDEKNATYTDLPSPVFSVSENGRKHFVEICINLAKNQSQSLSFLKGPDVLVERMQGLSDLDLENLLLMKRKSIPLMCEWVRRDLRRSPDVSRERYFFDCVNKNGEALQLDEKDMSESPNSEEEGAIEEPKVCSVLVWHQTLEEKGAANSEIYAVRVWRGEPLLRCICEMEAYCYKDLWAVPQGFDPEDVDRHVYREMGALMRRYEKPIGSQSGLPQSYFTKEALLQNGQCEKTV